MPLAHRVRLVRRAHKALLVLPGHRDPRVILALLAPRAKPVLLVRRVLKD